MGLSAIKDDSSKQMYSALATKKERESGNYEVYSCQMLQLSHEF